MAKVIDLVFLIRLDICVAIEQKEQGWCLLTDFGFFFIRFRDFPPQNLTFGYQQGLRQLCGGSGKCAQWPLAGMRLVNSVEDLVIFIVLGN